MIGTKELVAWLPTLLGAPHASASRRSPTRRTTSAPGSPAPTGSVVEATVALGPERLDLLWLNSPANPTGRVLPPAHLRKVVDWARERGTIVASDECYADLYYGDEPPVSVLSPAVCGDSHDGLLAVHSLSKRSNLAGYRAGFVAGDPALVARLLEVRKHAGMIVPAPVQAAMIAALGDDAHVTQQRARYAARRTALLAALRAAGSTSTTPAPVSISGRPATSRAGTPSTGSPSAASWSRRASSTARPGARHVRVALTATDERVDARR